MQYYDKQYVRILYYLFFVQVNNISNFSFITRCNQDRWLAKQWHNVCSEGNDTDLNRIGESQMLSSDPVKSGNDIREKFSANNFLKSMVDEQRHGNDRYIAKIWKKFHPEERSNVDKKVTRVFTFNEHTHSLSYQRRAILNYNLTLTFNFFNLINQ